MKQRLLELHARLKPHWRKILLFGLGGLLAVIILGQLLYPNDRLVFFTTIDGVNLSGWSKTDAIQRLDIKYADKNIPIFFGKAKKAYRSPKTTEIGLTISNETRVKNIAYPWYLRIVPTSILWAHFIKQRTSQPSYSSDGDKLSTYIDKELGSSCDVKPQDAILKVSGDKIEVVPSEDGGTCNVTDLKKLLAEAKPLLNNDFSVKIAVKVILPNVSDELAQIFSNNLQTKIGSGISVVVNGTAQIIPVSNVLSWIDFSSANGLLTYTFNTERATAYLNDNFAYKMALAAGTTTVNTYDFIETSRVNGADGKQLDISGTLNNLKSFINGESADAQVATSAVVPKVVYTRSYSATDTGLSALMQQYAQDHAGVFGVSLIELSGQNRRASYNETNSFTTASTYKLFVAYSTLKRIESGIWKWTDKITADRDLSVCFDDMIVRSDNTCGSLLLEKVGYKNITNEAHEIGCSGTSFLGSSGIKTTAADLSLLLAELQSGQILNQQTNRDILINAMKRNVYRNGIPAGLGGSTVADKVGFMDGLLHDASIVYSPNSTYVLVIMTDGSSWSTIADFAKQIEALRIQ